MQLILASRSPRRSELLTAAGIWDRLEARAGELADQAAEAERRALEAGAEQAWRDAEAAAWRGQSEHSERAVAALRAELEELARLLIEAEPAAMGRAA